MNALLPFMYSLLVLLCLALIRHAIVRRIIVLPDVFYLLGRRQALMLPLYDEPGVEIESVRSRHASLRLREPLDARVDVNVELKGAEEHFALEIRCEAPEKLDTSISIHHAALGVESPAPSASTIYIRFTPEGHPARELRTGWHVACDLLGGASALQHIVPTSGALVLRASSSLSNPRVFAMLTRVSGHKDRLTLRYEGAIKEDLLAGPAARDAMRSMLDHYRKEGVALASWSERALHELAISALEDEARSSEVKRLAAFVLLDFYDVASVDPHALRERMHRAVRAHWTAFDLDELLARMHPAFFDGSETSLLVAMAGQSTDARLRDTIKARTSKVDLITDTRINAEMRRDALVAAMRMKRAFLRTGEALVQAIDATHAGWVLEVFVQHGWDALWTRPWLEQRVARWFEEFDLLAHNRLHEQLERQLGVSSEARGAARLFEKIYARWVEQSRVELIRCIPTGVLTAVLARRANFEQDALAWSHLFTVIEEEHLRSMFDYTSLDESQRLELLARIVHTDRTRAMSDRHGHLRARLLVAFEISSAAASSISIDTFDEVARELLHCDESAFFDQPDASKHLRYAIKAYVRQVDRQGVRKGAMATIRVIAASLPASDRSWTEGVITRWTEQMGSDTMSGALTYRDEDDRVGALSVERGEG